MNDFSSALSDLFGSSNQGQGLLGDIAGQTMVDPNMRGGFGQVAQNLATQGGDQLAKLGILQQPQMTAAVMPEAGLFDSLKQSAKDWATGGTVLQDMNQLAKLGGGLYQAMQNKRLLDEQLKTAQQNRAFAADEKQRQKDFIGTTASTFGGGNSSNYYSA